MKNIDEKRERFIKIVERRVNQILKDLDSLSKCSNKKNYKYSDQDIKKIFNELERKTKEIKIMFNSNKKENNEFKLE